MSRACSKPRVPAIEAARHGVVCPSAIGPTSPPRPMPLRAPHLQRKAAQPKRTMSSADQVGSIVWFTRAIEALPSDEPVALGTPGYNRYTTQKAHWLGWLNPAAGTGTYPRSEAPGRDAKYVYNHIVEPKLLLWLIAASGVNPSVVQAAQQAAASVSKLPGKSAAVRRVVPWAVLCEQLSGRPSEA